MVKPRMRAQLTAYQRVKTASSKAYIAQHARARRPAGHGLTHLEQQGASLRVAADGGPVQRGAALAVGEAPARVHDQEQPDRVAEALIRGPVQRRALVSIRRIHIGVPSQCHVVQERCLPVLSGNMTYLQGRQANSGTGRWGLSSPDSSPLHAHHGVPDTQLLRLLIGEDVQPHRVAAAVLRREVRAGPEQRFSGREGSPHSGPVQGILSARVSCVDGRAALQQERAACDAVVQRCPLQRVVALLVRLRFQRTMSRFAAACHSEWLKLQLCRK